MKTSMRQALWAVPSLISLSVSLMGASNALAAGANGVGLEELLSKAVESHPTILEKRGSLAAAQQALAGARWQLFPNLSAETSANPTQGTTQVVRIEQPLWSGGRISANISANEARLRAAESALQESEQQILLKTATLFAELVRLGSRLDAAKDNIDEHERLLGLIQRRSESGIASPSEVISAKARLQQARSELLQLQTAALNAKADLEQMTQISVVDLKVSKPGLEVAQDKTVNVEKALAFSPALRRLAAETLSAEADIQARKSAMLPKVSLRHEQIWGRNYSTDQTYVALTVQTGNGLSASTAIREAESQRSASIERESSLRMEISTAVRTDWNKVRSSKAETEVLRELTESTREMYESFVRQYAAGRKFWLDVLSARSESIKARNALVDAEWGGMLAIWRLQIATGEMTPESLRALRPPVSGTPDTDLTVRIGMIQP